MSEAAIMPILFSSILNVWIRNDQRCLHAHKKIIKTLVIAHYHPDRDTGLIFWPKTIAWI